jgi:hypothetical protein
MYFPPSANAHAQQSCDDGSGEGSEVILKNLWEKRTNALILCSFYNV